MSHKTVIVLVLAVLASSCKKDETPASSGTITLDGKTFTKLYLSSIYPPTYSSQGANGLTIYEVGVNVSGDGGYFFSTNVLSTSRSLAAGVYTFFDKTAAFNQGMITYCDVSFGDTNNQIVSSNSRQGTFTVAIKGDRYTFDFSGTIDGHVITVHYEGLSHVFS